MGALLSVLLACRLEGQPAARPIVAEWSPGVAWDPNIPRATGLRPLTATERQLAQQRAAGFHAAFGVAPSFRTPTDRAHLVVSDASVEPRSPTDRRPIVQQSVIAYFSVPRDTRRLPSGVLAPKVGGAHDLIVFELNRRPLADQLVDRATAGNFSRGVEPRRPGGVFAMPRLFDAVGGGFVFADMLVFTRDGRSPLEPAPIGPLLDDEIARLTSLVDYARQASTDRVREAEASLAPAAVAERRATREAAWRRETPDPAVLTRRLDAAHRSDVAAVEQTRQDFGIPDSPTPGHRYREPKLALDAARALLAELGAAGRGRPACGWTEGDSDRSTATRYAVVGTRTNCVPMVRVREDLLDPARPASDIQLLIIPFFESRCGEMLGGATPYRPGGRCGYGVPLLRELDWGGLRAAMGWSRTP
jgi:hypothetical protein